MLLKKKGEELLLMIFSSLRDLGLKIQLNVFFCLLVSYFLLPTFYRLIQPSNLLNFIANMLARFSITLSQGIFIKYFLLLLGKLCFNYEQKKYIKRKLCCLFNNHNQVTLLHSLIWLSINKKKKQTDCLYLH